MVLLAEGSAAPPLAPVVPTAAADTPPWGWEAWVTTAAIASAFALMLLDLAKVSVRRCHRW